MNPGELIESMGAADYTVTRTTTAQYVGGYAQPGVESTFSIRAHQQPWSGRVLDSPPEHDRVSETRKMWTTVELWTRKPTREPDSVEIEGEPWTVIEAKFYAGFDGDSSGHYECVVERDDIG